MVKFAHLPTTNALIHIWTIAPKPVPFLMSISSDPNHPNTVMRLRKKEVIKMKDYVFRVLLPDGSVTYAYISADNLPQARVLFQAIAVYYPKDWCLVGVYRRV